jgi:hypothetical protein
MTKATRTPLRLHPAIVIPVIVACLALIAWKVSYIVPLAVVGQAYLVILVLLGFRYWPPMIRLVQRMPVPHRVIFALLIGGMIVGHFRLNSRKYFPFVAWEIFSTLREEDPITCRELIATTASGRSVRLLVEQLVPSIIQFDLPARPDETERLTRALAALYNRQHADDPVRRIDLMVMAVKLHPSSAESRSQPSCELLQRYEISSDR